MLGKVRIPRNTEVGKQILWTRKQISKELGRKITISDESYLERERQRLINSEDAEEVEKGEKMVTTVSILRGQPLDDQTIKNRVSKTKAATILGDHDAQLAE